MTAPRAGPAAGDYQRPAPGRLGEELRPQVGGPDRVRLRDHGPRGGPHTGRRRVTGRRPRSARPRPAAHPAACRAAPAAFPHACAGNGPARCRLRSRPLRWRTRPVPVPGCSAKRTALVFLPPPASGDAEESLQHLRCARCRYLWIGHRPPRARGRAISATRQAPMGGSRFENAAARCRGLPIPCPAGVDGGHPAAGDEQAAVAARAGLGANQPDNAIYPVLAADADGASLAGDNYYLCRGPIS
jgi:hypothetical protein